MADKNPDFSTRLSEIVLNELKMNKQEFAELVGIHINSVTNYLERGVVPEWHILLKISEATKKSVDFLLRGSAAQETRSSGKIRSDAGGEKRRVSETEWTFLQALRNMDSLSQRAIFLLAGSEANRALHEREVKKDKRKKEILEKAVKVLSKAASDV